MRSLGDRLVACFIRHSVGGLGAVIAAGPATHRHHVLVGVAMVGAAFVLSIAKEFRRSQGDRHERSAYRHRAF